MFHYINDAAMIFVGFYSFSRRFKQELEFKIFTKTGVGAGIKPFGIGVELESKISDSDHLGLGTFICQVASTRRQRSDLFGLRVKLPPVTTSFNLSKVVTIPLSALPKDTTSELAGLSPH